MAGPTAHLAWNANPELDIDHYLLFMGNSPGPPYNAPGSPANVGDVTSAFFPLPSFGTWYSSLQAVNTSGLISPFSSEVSQNFPSPPTPYVPLRPHRFHWVYAE